MKRLSLLIAFMLMPLAGFSQLPDSTLFKGAKKDTVLNQPRPEDISLNPQFFINGLGAPCDTIDVGDGAVQVVLKDDHTWYYIKNLDKIAGDDIFTEYWDTQAINPYKNIPLDSIGWRNTICLVDSLSHFVCPHQGTVFSKFGIRHGRNHTGCDVPYPLGTTVYCAFDGRVRYSGWCHGYGNLVIVRHANGLETFYGHLSRRDVLAGEWIHAGDVIGLGGSTGRSTGPHLHFETRYRGYAFDPEWVVDFANGKLRSNILVLRRSQLSVYSKYVPDSVDDEEGVYKTDEEIKAEEDRIAAERAAMRYHTVKSGDTLGRIAINNHTTVSKICSLNPGLKPTTTLKIGRKIRVK